jgi:hypothetical protein
MQIEIQKGRAVLAQAAVSKADEASVYELLKNLNSEGVEYVEEFFSGKRQANITNYEQRKVILERAKADPDKALRTILANYGFRANTRFRKTMVLEIDLPPQLQKLSIVNGDFKFLTGNFRDANWVKTGCLGEMAFTFLMNCALHFFNIEYRLPMMSSQNLLYGGDGGDDFRVGQSSLDIKYRDDNPAKGMALQNKFLKSSLRDPECLLIQMSNITNDQKLGHSVVNTPITQIKYDLPMAMAGWVTVAEYDERKESFGNGFSDWIVDDLNGPSELIIRLVEEINDNESLFEL